jgi:hypothetical protein
MEANNAQRTIAHTQHDGFAFFGLTETTQGAEFGTAEQAKAMLNRVVTALKDDKRKPLEHLNDVMD